ncbi:MAG: AMP-binding protein, partial [Desulfobacterales bacterium]|nr:AMP-binding protein [Desulfobacterales bacterium]
VQPLEEAVKQSEELPPAFSDGGPLDIPADAPLTLGQALVKTAATRGHLGIIVVQDMETGNDEGKEVFISYADLLAAGERILTGLQAKGLGPGDRVILQLADMTAYFKSFWACMLGGIIPVTIAVDTGYTEKSGVVKKLWNSWKLLECPPVIAEADTARALAGVPDLFKDEDDTGTPFSIFSYEGLAASDRNAKIHKGSAEDVAFHQLTSGSTGIPKCVQITNSGAIHYIYGAVSFGNTDTDITLNWLPMDHVVPLLTCHLKDVYLGNQQIQVHPRLVLANPLIWLDLLDKHRCTYTWAPNFGFKLLTDALNEVPDRAWDITPLKFLLTGGEQITLPVIADIHRQLTGFGMDPDAMRSGYGMAEIGTVAVNPNVLKPETSADRFLKSSLNGVLEETDIEGESSVVFMNLGPARAGVQFRIVDDDNQQLPEKTIGNLQVRGGIVTPGYLNNDEVNREAFAGDGWFNTGDRAFIRDSILTITGRVKETIIICGANYYCYEIEDIVNDIQGVEPTFSAAVAVDNPKMGSEGLAIFFVPKAWTDPETTNSENADPESTEIDIPLIRSVRNKVGKELGISPEYVIPMAKKEFPKTTSGKLQRTDLKKGLDRGDFSNVIKQIELAGESRNTLPDWFFEKVWIRKTPACHPAEGRGACLVFTADVPLYNAITAKQPGQYIRIEPGIAYEKRSDDHYTVRAAVAEDYEKLLSDLKRDGINFTRILHLSAMAPRVSEINPAGINTAMDIGVRSLLGLYRAVSSLTAADRPDSWLTAGTGLLDVKPDDPLAVEHAAIPGLINVLDQELPGIHCRL